MTARMLHEAVIRRIGDTHGFELLLDGEVFPFHLERQEVEVELMADNPPLYALRFGIFAESVVGAAEFNEFLAEQADASRVRIADERDIRLMLTRMVPVSEFWREWEKV